MTAETFADPARRRRWIDEKHTTELNLYSDTFCITPVVLLVTEPFDLATAYKRADLTEIEGVRFRFLDLATLVAMKEAAGRPVDLDDARHLRLLLNGDGPRDRGTRARRQGVAAYGSQHASPLSDNLVPTNVG